MKIYFCDLCNESVPQGDLDLGLAVLRRGRVVCVRCERAMSHETAPAEAGAAELADAYVGAAVLADAPPLESVPAPGPAVVVREGHPARPAGAHAAPAPRPERGVAGGLALGISVVALVAVVATAAYLYRALEQSREQGRAMRHEMALERDDLLRQQDQRFEQRVAPLGQEVGAVRGEAQKLIVRLEEATRHQGEVLAALREDLTSIDERVRGFEGSGEDLTRHEREIGKVADTLAGLHGEVLRLAERLAEAQVSAAPAPLDMGAGAEPVAAKPAWWGLVDDLASQNSGARWQAVQALGDTRDPAVAEYLAPMLEDPDIFVRMATARILGDLKAVLGIPALIDGLEDPEPSVREAAFVSLRAVSGRDLRFEPDAKETERAKQVKAWRDWWKRAEQELLGGEPTVKSTAGR